MFSILIPTWNNLPYLQLCLESLRKNAVGSHQIILHINEGTDGTLQWVKDQKLDYTYSERNLGICTALNLMAMKAVHPYILYLNDDMYCCPDWDKYLIEEIKRMQTDCFMLSATLIEPLPSRNTCVIVADFGQDAANFKEQRLIDEFRKLPKDDWSGSTWPPTLIHKKYWGMVGGYSLEFSPGMSSDDDFSMKMWQIGCRIFKGVAQSRVYHFQRKSTERVIKNNGRKQFLMKWGINQSTFRKYYLSMGEPYEGILADPPHTYSLKLELLRAWLKRKLM